LAHANDRKVGVAGVLGASQVARVTSKVDGLRVWSRGPFALLAARLSCRKLCLDAAYQAADMAGVIWTKSH